MFNALRSRSRSRESEMSRDLDEIIVEREDRDEDLEGRELGDMGDLMGSDQSLLDARETTAGHPLGRLLIKAAADVTNLAKHTNVKETEANINELCREFKASLDLEAQRFQNMLKENNQRFEMELISKELDIHKVNNNVSPPTIWGNHPTLTTPIKISTAQKMFPGIGKFKGYPRDGFLNIIEFLSVMKTAQEHCKLSKQEYLDRMILCSTGEAHELIVYGKEQGESIDDIYHSLVMRFDDRITPEDAKQKLQSFKATKNMNLAKVESQIMIWANRASTQFPAGESRQAFYNLEACNCLIKALPNNSAITAGTVYNSLTARLQRAPTYSFFTRALNSHRDIIDRDLRASGAEPGRFGKFNNNNRKAPPPRGYNRNKKMNFSTYSVTVNPSGSAVSSMPFKTRTPFQTKGNTYSGNTYQNTYQNKGQNNRVKSSTFRNSNQFKPKQSVNFIPLNQNGRGYRPNNAASTPGFKRNMSGNRFGNSKNRNFSKNYSSANTAGNKGCSLCGYRNHKSPDCRNIRDDAGNIKQIIPTMGTCNICPTYLKVRMHHPPIYCPYRSPHGIFCKNQN